MTKETKVTKKSDSTFFGDEKKEANGFKTRVGQTHAGNSKHGYHLTINGEDKTSELIDADKDTLGELKIRFGFFIFHHGKNEKLKGLFESASAEGLKEFTFKHEGKDLRVVLGKGAHVTLNIDSRNRMYDIDDGFDGGETIVRDYRLQGLFHPSFGRGNRKDSYNTLVVLNSVVELRYVGGVNLIINQDISEGSLTSSYIYNEHHRDYVKFKNPTICYSEIEEGNLADNSYVVRSVLRDSSVSGKHISITNSALVETRIHTEDGLNVAQTRLDRSNINCFKGTPVKVNPSFEEYSDLNIYTVNDIFIKRKVDVLEYSIGDVALIGVRKGSGYPRTINDENDVEMIITMPYRYADKTSEIVVNEKDTRAEISAKVSKLIFNRDTEKMVYLGPFQSNSVESVIVESFSDAIMSRLRLLAMIDSTLHVGI